MASLDVHRNQHPVENVENISDPFDKAIKKFEFHPLNFISLIKNRIAKNTYQNLFCFNEVTKVEVLKETNYINNKKATPFNAIPSKNFILKILKILKILNVSSECSADTLTSLVNKSLTSSRKCHSNLKLKILKPKKTID